ncbi:MAG: ABC transporter substrate-binding protein [Coriobacteriia bacterium]
MKKGLLKTHQFTRRDFIRLGAVGAASLSLSSLVGCIALDEFFSGMRTITDQAGRSVSIPTPGKLGKVYFTSLLAQIFCFTVAPDLLGGTATSFTEKELAFLPKGMGELDNMGSLSSGGVIDVKALPYHDVQVIFSISGTDLSDVNIADAIGLQEQTGIPVVLIDGSFDRIGETYRLLGDCLGREERAGALASYCEDIYRRVTEAVAKVPAADLVSYYFAEGPEGLQTEPDVSQHSLAFQAARGVNVAADVDPEEEGRSAGVLNNHDMVNVTMEEIVSWDPEFIVSWDFKTRSGADKFIRSTPRWANISAVKSGRVYTMPNLPFAFCDRPPGLNRFLGIQWLANLFYPDYYDVDMVEVVRDFYSTCYWRDISVEQAKGILNPS